MHRFDAPDHGTGVKELQELLAELLDEAGFTCELVGPDPTRPNLVAEIDSGVEGPSLGLLGRVDANFDKFARWHPTQYDIDDEEGQAAWAATRRAGLASQLSAAITLGRDGWRPRRGRLRLVSTSGGSGGSVWLCSNRPELVECDQLIAAEGGGGFLGSNNVHLYPLATAERGRLRIRIGDGGGDAEAVRAEVLDLKSRRKDNPILDDEPEVLALMAALGEDLSGPAEGDDPITQFGQAQIDPDALRTALAHLHAEFPDIVKLLLEPTMSVTFRPARVADEVRAAANAEGEVVVDAWVAPELNQRQAVASVERYLEGTGLRITGLVSYTVGSRSPLDTPLYKALVGWMLHADPGSELVPMLRPGPSEIHWFRATFDTIAYGFCPFMATIPTGMERVAEVLDPVVEFFKILPVRVLK